MTASPGLCIVHPNPTGHCESFINAHLKGLHNVRSVLYGGHMPLFHAEGEELHPGLPADPAKLFSPNGLCNEPNHEAAANNVASHLRNSGAKVVLAEYGPTGVAMLEPCRIAGAALVTHFHGFDASLKAVLAKYASGYRRLFAANVLLIGVSNTMHQDLLGLGAPKENIRINPYGVDPDLFGGGCPEEALPTFLSVGRFVDKKAPEAVLTAFGKVQEAVPEARLVMVGDGVLKDACVRLAKHLGIADKVEFTGNLPHQEVARRMRDARCLVQHSATPESGDKEGTPNAVLEAGGSGLPVVATRHAGIPDVVIHGETGLLCEEMDVPGMAANMRFMAENPREAGKMGRAARRRIFERFLLADRLETLVSFLHEAVQGGTP